MPWQHSGAEMYLTTRSDFSFLRSYGTIDQIVDRAVALRHDYVGLADYLSTWGHIKFLRKCESAGIKPLLGVCVPVVKEIEKDPRYDLFSIIAKNNDGLQEIYELLGKAAGQKYYRNRITWKQLYELENVFLIADHVSPSNSFMIQGDKVMISLSPKSGSMLHMAREFQTAIFNPAPLYPKPQDAEAHSIISKISEMAKMGELKLGYGPMLSRTEVIAQFKPFDIDPSAAMTCADSIADQCDVSIKQATNVKPVSTMTVEEWARAGAEERGIDLDEETYSKRFNLEMAIIREKSFEDYFTLVGDLVRYAKEHMLVGPGRGSAGGSLICYLMGITELDPIQHGTLFERFIDPARSDYPDIDIDFPDSKRHLVFEYLGKRYGGENVARIGTITEFKNKSAINDAARALGIPFDISRQLGAAIPDGMSLTDAFQREDIQGLIKGTNITKALLLEGHARHHGVHAAGVCVSADPITNFASVSDGVAAITLEDAEAVGLLKIDALGLKTLSVVEECCEMAQIDPTELYELRQDDSAVWEVFNQDKVAGIFQFEGHAVRQLMKSITVERFSDLYCLSSLARPGPLDTGSAHEWCKRRSGEENWEYLHESLVEVTEETTGIIIFQEQAMRIAKEIGGIEDGNKFRKAISKKDPEILHTLYEEFIVGATRIMERKYAQVLWDQIEAFGGYGFNKSHAVAYSMLTYICAWLKAYYPVEYAVAQLRHSNDDEKAKILLRELMEEGYDFVPFDADKSDVSWSYSDGKIYGGFTSVKGVGAITAEKFVAQRSADPQRWLETITPVQRKRLLSPNNTPWHDIDRMGRIYADLYSSPDEYKTTNIPYGIGGKVYKIANIPEGKSNNIRFIGRLKRKQYRDKNDPADVNKRDGQKIPGDSVFLNLYFEDDTGDVGCTISRFKYPAIGEPIWQDEDAEGRDYLVKGAIINDDRVWIFIDSIVEISNDERIIPVVEVRGSDDMPECSDASSGEAGADITTTSEILETADDVQHEEK